MKYGIKTFSQVPNPDEVPVDCVAISVSYEDNDSKIEQQLIDDNYTIMTSAQYDSYVQAHQSEFDAWAEDHLKEPLKQSIKDQIDLKTNDIINTGFTYQNMQFKLDLEHQNSYMFDYLLNQTYPHTIKGVGKDYITFQDKNEHTLFIANGFGYVDYILRNGWELKDGLDALTYQQLLVWTDPR